MRRELGLQGEEAGGFGLRWGESRGGGSRGRRERERREAEGGDRSGGIACAGAGVEIEERATPEGKMRDQSTGMEGWKELRREKEGEEQRNREGAGDGEAGKREMGGRRGE